MAVRPPGENNPDQVGLRQPLFRLSVGKVGPGENNPDQVGLRQTEQGLSAPSSLPGENNPDQVGLRRELTLLFQHLAVARRE